MSGIITALILTASLLLAAPSWSIDYSSSASLDLSTLQFSGVVVDLTPTTQIQSAILQLGMGGPITQDVGIPGFTEGSLETPWHDITTTVSIPGIGSATAISAPLSLSTSAFLQGSGTAGSGIFRTELMTAHSTGFVTISLQYTVAQSAVPSVVLGTNGQAHTYIELNLNGESLSSHGELSGTNLLTRTGRLNLTRMFTAGQTMAFNMSVGTERSVPIPTTLWPVLLGLVGAALVSQRART